MTGRNCSKFSKNFITQSNLDHFQCFLVHFEAIFKPHPLAEQVVTNQSQPVRLQTVFPFEKPVTANRGHGHDRSSFGHFAVTLTELSNTIKKAVEMFPFSYYHDL